MSTTSVGADPGSARGRRREQRAWYWYDWANSAFVTTTGTVMFAPYLISVAEQAACGRSSGGGSRCTEDLSLLGLPVDPGSIASYVVTCATLVSAVVLPVIGAVVDRSARKKQLLGVFAWTGSLAAMSMFFVSGTRWQLGVALMFVATICLGASLVVYNALLCQISTPDERDRVSSRGWALGYLGGALLLGANLVVYLNHDALGLQEGLAVRLSLLSAGLWWAGFTVIPYLGLRNRPVVGAVPQRGGLVTQSFGQLWTTLKDLRRFPVTLTFLVAYLFYNDGIQTVITSAAVYGEKELGFETSVMIGTILIVQFVAFLGALAFGRLARTLGSRRSIMLGLGGWMLVVVIAFVLPAGQVVPFLLLGCVIGLVMGGTQALSRSFFSLLVPRGREAEYFSLYEATERGTSWLGTLIFGVVYQWTGSYRPSIIAVIVFFVVGLALLVKVDPRRGITEAGNDVPAVV